jgi:hypothetical protein
VAGTVVGICTPPGDDPTIPIPFSRKSPDQYDDAHGAAVSPAAPAATTTACFPIRRDITISFKFSSEEKYEIETRPIIPQGSERRIAEVFLNVLSANRK